VAGAPSVPVKTTQDCGTIGTVTDRAIVSQWLAGYETAWLAPGTAGLAGLFTADATYLQSPYEQPVTGLDAIKRMWEEQREGPREVFTLVTEILAVDGPTAVVRAEVRYGTPLFRLRRPSLGGCRNMAPGRWPLSCLAGGCRVAVDGVAARRGRSRPTRSR
jgi:hypothetical protein